VCVCVSYHEQSRLQLYTKMKSSSLKDKAVDLNRQFLSVVTLFFFLTYGLIRCANRSFLVGV